MKQQQKWSVEDHISSTSVAATFIYTRYQSMYFINVTKTPFKQKALIKKLLKLISIEDHAQEVALNEYKCRVQKSKITGHKRFEKLDL